MNAFLQWLSTNDILAITVIVTINIILISVALIYLVAFFQGRKISFWPPTIGEKNSIGKNTGNDKRTIEIESITYSNANDMMVEFMTSIQKAMYVDDVIWMDKEEDKPEHWTGQDRVTQQHLRETVDRVIRKSTVIWRQIRIFRTVYNFEKEKKNILDTATKGYNIAYFEPQLDTVPPQFGFAIVVYEDGKADVFLSSSKSRLRIRHAAIVEFFSQYFNLAWERAKKLKRGEFVDKKMLQELENLLISQEQS